MSPNTSQINPVDSSGEKGNSMMSGSKKDKMDISIESARQPMLSPSETHKDYQRFKYYSALRTGYGHLGVE